MVKKGRLMVI